MNLKKIIGIVVVAVVTTAPLSARKQLYKTFCNPLDLAYRFQYEGSYREAADPVIVTYKNQYWLFASKSGGYWFSDQLAGWKFVPTTDLPVEIYAPAVISMNDSLYYLAGNQVYVTAHPESGKWTLRARIDHEVTDPALFRDDDGRLYLFHGCRENKPLLGVELDPHSFRFVGTEKEIIAPQPATRGWEVAGNNNNGKTAGDTSQANFLPWIEGSWVNKWNGKYYWQYAGPGTQFRSYADGVFVSDSALSGYQYAPYSPFSYKPAGFVTGTGHSCTFADHNQALWHVTTTTISVRHMFERRLSLFPVALMPDGQLVCNTYLGDYPQHYTQDPKKQPNTFSGWMLLSYRKPVSVSSTKEDDKPGHFAASNAIDEDMCTWWSASGGKAGEWIEVDLQKRCTVYSLQLNQADEGATASGRLTNDGYAYCIQLSVDRRNWVTVYDNTAHPKDHPHHYLELPAPITARYVRVTNAHAPAGSCFSLSDLRMFGKAPGAKPQFVQGLSARRDSTDRRSVTLNWAPSEKADFYIIRYGIAPNKLYSSYPVYSAENIKINSLNASSKYYFSIDAINECGISKGKQIIELNN